jgi:hypothetical protein
MGNYMKQEYDDRVMAIRMRAVVTDDRRLELIMPDEIPPGEVEILVFSPSQGDASVKVTGGLDRDVQRALQFFQTIQQCAASHQRPNHKRPPVEEEQAEDTRLQR